MDDLEPKKPRVRRQRVQDLRALKISELKALGLLKPGETTKYIFPGAVYSAYSCYLNVEQPFFFIQYDDHGAIIRLVTRKVGRGIRYFFQDRNDVICTKLYPYHGSYASRQTAGLAYLSQVQSKLDRKIAKAKRISYQVLGKPGRGPARGKSREKLLAKLGHAKDELEKIVKTIERERRKPQRLNNFKVEATLSFVAHAKETVVEI